MSDSRTDPPWLHDNPDLGVLQEDLPEDNQIDMDDDESSVLNSLRKGHRRLKKELKAADIDEAEIRAEVTRDFDIEQHLKSLGHPAGMLDTVKGKLGDNARVDKASVRDALIAIGFDEESVDQSSQPGSKSPVQPVEPIVPGTALSAEITALVVGQPKLEMAIANAETEEELAEIMEEAGLTTKPYG